MKKQLIEQNIIGHLLFTLSDIPKVLQTVSLDDFSNYRKHIQILFTCWKEGKEVYTELSSNGLKDIADLSTGIRVGFNISNACKELKELSTSDRVKGILTTASKEVPTEGIDAFIADVQQSLIKQTNNVGEKTDIETVLKEFTDNQLVYEEKRKSGVELIGLSCGYEKLDSLIDGLRPGHLWVLGGYTSLGKTFGALNIANHLIKGKKRIVIYTLEMSRVDIVSRILGVSVGENSRSIAKGYIDQSRLNPALDKLTESDISIISQRRELNQILLSMHEEMLRKPVDLFIVDYLGLINVKGAKSEYEQVKEASLEIQNAAKRFNVPTIVLSQVSNDAARSGESMVMGFKGAGDIAAAADLAIELVSGEESNIELKAKMQKGEPVKIKWQVKKNRHGPVGYIMMEFNGMTGVFKEMDEDAY